MKKQTGKIKLFAVETLHGARFEVVRTSEVTGAVTVKLLEDRGRTWKIGDELLLDRSEVEFDS